VVFIGGKNQYHQFMKTIPSRNLIPFDQPATYQISVQGWIDPALSDLLEGMTICQDTVEENSKITTLEGELSDQAALAGVFNTLYQMRLPVIGVKRLEV
jgi:hypothetical protein